MKKSSMKINIDKFGEKNITLYEVEGTKELFLACFSHQGEEYSAIIDKDGRALTSFSTQPFQEVFTTKDKENYGFTRYDTNQSNYESFHLQKDQSGIYQVKTYVQSDDNVTSRLVNTIKDEFWFLESTSNGITEIALYDVKQAKLITPYFTDISFEEEEGRVLAFVEKDICVIDDGEVIPLAGLLSYIDWDGNFVAPIYIPEKDEQYPSLLFNHSKGFSRFYAAVNELTKRLVKEYYEKDEHIDEVLTDMFNNLYTEEEVNPKRQAKILEFRKKDQSND